MNKIKESPHPASLLTEKQLKRKQKSISIISEMRLPFLEELPVIADEADVTPRRNDEIAERCLAVAVCAVKGETKDQKLTEEIIRNFAAKNYFTLKEKAFIENRQTDEQELTNFAWRYECVHIFLWALGFLSRLKPPHQVCDLSDAMSVIGELGPKEFITQARLRPMKEILDMADLYYRLHWAAIELKNKAHQTISFNEEIIMERYRALNWLIRHRNEEWDEITIDTWKM